MKNFREYSDLQTFANAFAKWNHFNRADSIVVEDLPEGISAVIKNRIAYGHRKYTTGEYVPNAYLHNFGWKNTYYQAAHTTVAVSPKVAKHFKLI